MQRIMGEPAHKASPNAMLKENMEISGSCLQPCDNLNELSTSLSLDSSVANNTANSNTDSTSNDKPKKIKKNRKKGKKNSKLRYNIIAEIEPNELGQDIGASSYQSYVEETRSAKDDKVTVNCDNKIVNCNKSTQRVPPPVIASAFARQPTNLFLKDAKNNDGKLFSEHSFGGHSDYTGSYELFDDTVISGKSTKGIMQEAEVLNTTEQKIAMHCNNCSTKDLKENISLGYFSQYKPYKANNMMSSNFEGCNAGSTDRSKPNNHCTNFGFAHAVTPREPYNIISQSDMLNKPRYHHSIQTGKENSNSIWQKGRRSIRDPCTHVAKRSNHIHSQDTLLMKDNSFSSNALLPSPVVSSAGHMVFAHGFQEVLKNKQGLYSRTHYDVMVESSQWMAQQRFHGGLNQYGTELRQDATLGNRDGGMFKEMHNESFKHEKINNSKKGVGGCKSNLLRLQNGAILSQKEALEISEEVHHYNNKPTAHRSIDESGCLHSYATSARVQLSMPQTRISSVSNRALLPGSYTSMRIPWTENASLGSVHASLDNVQRNPTSINSKFSYKDNKQDFNSRESSQKWLPVGKKDSGMLKNNDSVCATTSLTLISCKEKADSHPEANPILVSESLASVDPDKACLMSNQETPKLMTIKSETPQFDQICKSLEDNHRDERARECVTPGSRANGAPLLYIGSRMAAKTLSAAYRLYIASESVRLATGTPLAEFERLLHTATPVMAPSVYLGNQLSNSSLCKHRTQSIPLSAVWSWYEKPGNYGLEVKAEDSQNLKGLDTGSVSFNAHFVPFLSAVQLFGYSLLSRHNSSSIRHVNFEMRENEEGEHLAEDIPYPGTVGPSHFQVEEISVSTLKSVDKPMCSSENCPVVGSDSSGLSSELSCSEDMELLFEFFEHEQPQQRKPFYDKIKELVKAGNSNYQVFGDPSKLECMNLHDLHPASWYSVAWYPIYRIPEGNFRASFLTYHALGHLVQRCSTDSLKGNQFCVVSPVLGLQSYNVKGECWFYPKKPVESCSKGFTSFDSSEILKERLRTLEETALLFARGCILKDHIKVANRQPDYEFFLSRKH